MCGATPLTIAVVNKNEELAQLLVQNFAIFDSRYFTTIPNPVTIAKKMDMDIVSTMENMSDQDLAEIVKFGRYFTVENNPATSRYPFLKTQIQQMKMKRTNTEEVISLV